MSDEPLWCPSCGQEIGPDHADCSFDEENDKWPADPFCNISGDRARNCGCPHCTRST
jgi:hypothetical protein